MTEHETHHHNNESSDTRDELQQIHERLAEVLGNATNTDVANRFNMNTETVRRQRTEQRPQIHFLKGLVDAFGVNLNWLLTGEGQPYSRDLERQAIQHIPDTLLHEEIGRRIRENARHIREIKDDLEQLKAAHTTAPAPHDHAAPTTDA